jgi:hypothetical protein
MVAAFSQPSLLDISVLRCRSESGYRNVYYARKSRDGLPVWVARVKRGGRLTSLPGSRSTDPRESARHVLRWYRQEFGEQWRRALVGRKRPAVLVRRHPDQRGRYYAVLWIEGKRHEVVSLRRVPIPRRLMGRGPCERWERDPDALVAFWSREQAKHGAWLYAARLLGLQAYTAIYRVDEAQRRRVA